MATHKCGSCLRKTIEDCIDANLPDGMVPADSNCAPGCPHTWKEIGNYITPFLHCIFLSRLLLLISFLHRVVCSETTLYLSFHFIPSSAQESGGGQGEGKLWCQEGVVP